MSYSHHILPACQSRIAGSVLHGMSDYPSFGINNFIATNTNR